jgi:hypothetical protein
VPYVDPQDTARAASAKATREFNRELKVARDEKLALNERAKGSLFGDSRAMKGDEYVRAQCTLAGIVNEPEIQAAQARLREKDAALLKENPELTAEEYLDIVRAPGVALSPAAQAATVERLVSENTIPVYRTRSQVLEQLHGVNKQLPKERPILNQRLRQGAATSAPVVRRLLNDAAERSDATLRAKTVGKPWSVPKVPAPNADPGQWPFTPKPAA